MKEEYYLFKVKTKEDSSLKSRVIVARIENSIEGMD